MQVKRMAGRIFWLGVDELALASQVFLILCIWDVAGMQADWAVNMLKPGPSLRVLIQAARGILWWPTSFLLITLMAVVFVIACRPSSPHNDAVANALRWAILGSAALVFGSAFFLGYLLMTALHP